MTADQEKYFMSLSQEDRDAFTDDFLNNAEASDEIPDFESENVITSLPQFPKLDMVKDTSELFESANMFESHSRTIVNLMRDSVSEIVERIDSLFEGILLPKKCESCGNGVKCVEHFRNGRPGFIAEEFDSLFLGQFRTNHNR